MISRKVEKFLEKNNHKIRQSKGVWRVTKIRDLSWLIITGGFIGAIFFMMYIRDMTKGLIICLIIALIVDLAIRVLRRKPYLIIDNNIKRIELNRSKGELRLIPFSGIDEIFFHSKKVGEYASAFKQTSEEFEINIGVRITKSENYNLFKLEGDMEEPEEAKELFDSLKFIIRNSKKATI